MLTKQVLEALNAQIAHEFYASQVYLSMSAYCADAGLPGLATWLRAQAQEEREHALKLFDYILERQSRPTLAAIEAPPNAFDSVLDVFQKALAHEHKVTRQIHDLYALAVEDKDYATQVMLQWFIKEQVEEEASTHQVVAQLRMAGSDYAALLAVERELGKR